MADLAPPTKAESAKALADGLSAKETGLGGQADSLEKMARDAGPIIDTYNEVLVSSHASSAFHEHRLTSSQSRPYLKNYNAMANSIPVIGLKGDNVVYVQTKSFGMAVQDVWSVFSRIPDGAKITPAKSVHFFPYLGDFYMSVGTAVWRKRHRNRGDDTLKQAVNDWSKLYVDSWELVGERCLPWEDARSVLPFARFDGKGGVLSHVLAVTSNGKLQLLEGDLKATNAFRELRNATEGGDEDAKSMEIARACYSAGKVFACDKKNNTWNLTVNFDDNRFTAGDKKSADPISELTATDIGPVMVKSRDGFLYRRRIETTPGLADNGEKDNYGWEKWIDSDRVTNLGVASPGVMLDLETLTRALKGRYLSTQTAVYPVVEKLLSFATNHELFLTRQLQVAEEYKNHKGDKKKQQEIAMTEARRLINQTKAWSTLIRKQAIYTKSTVGNMAEELASVRVQLNQELVKLRDKLVSLEAQVKDLEGAKSNLDVGFWAMFGAALLGIGLLIFAVVTGGLGTPLLIVGGLFVAGIIGGTIALGIERGKMAQQIRQCQAEINGLKQSIQDLEEIAGRFGSLEGMYDRLSQFWGGMYNAAGNLRDNDEVSLALGEDILGDPTSIDTSLGVVRKMKKGCSVYLAVLNRSGIEPPPDPEDDMARDVDGFMEQGGEEDEFRVEFSCDVTFKTVHLFKRQADLANAALEAGEFVKYAAHLKAAEAIDVMTIDMGYSPAPLRDASNSHGETETLEPQRDWEDILFAILRPPTLDSEPANGHPVGGGDVAVAARRVNGSVNGGTTPAPARDMQRQHDSSPGVWLPKTDLAKTSAWFGKAVPLSGSSAAMGDLNAALSKARREVLMLTDKTLETTATAEDWVQRIPRAPDTDKGVAEMEGYRKSALASCAAARDSARLAKNAFAEFDRMAERQTQETSQEVSRLRDELAALDAVRNAKLAAVSNPPMGIIFLPLVYGPWKIAAQARENDIKESYANRGRDAREKVRALEQDLAALRESSGNAWTWAEFCDVLSVNLGGVYNLLGVIRDAVLVNATPYDAFVATQWGRIRREIGDVKALIYASRPAGDMVQLDAGAGLSPMLAVVSPPASIIAELQAQARNSELVWQNIDRLRTLTFTSDMVAYVDAASNRKVSLLEVIDSVHTAYISVAAVHYEAVEKISSLALLQTYRTDNLVKGRISPHVFLKGTFTAVSVARRQAGAAKGRLAAITNTLVPNLESAKLYVDALRVAVAGANLDVGRRDKAYRDKAVGVIVGACLNGFATGVLVGAAIAAAATGTAPAAIPALLSVAGALAVEGGGGEKKKKEEAEEPSKDATTNGHAGPQTNGPRTNGTRVNGSEVNGRFSAANGTLLVGVGTNGVRGKKRGAKAQADPKAKEESSSGGESPAKTDDEAGEASENSNSSKGSKGSKGGGKKKPSIPAEKRINAAKETWEGVSQIISKVKDVGSGTTLGKALFNKLSLPELAALLENLRVAVTVMERTVAAIEAARPPIDDLLASVGRLDAAFKGLDEGCVRFARELPLDARLAYTEKEAGKVNAEWQKVSDACDMWLAVFNKQRISPLSLGEE